MDVTSNEIKIAVIGTGSIGYRHLQVLRSIGVPSIAVSVRASRRVELEAEGWISATSLCEAADKGATAAVIATDTRRHVEDAKEALRLGFYALVEKPLAPTAQDAGELPGLAAKQGVSLVVGCPLRFDDGLRSFRRRLPELGNIHSVRIECRSYLPDWRPGRDYRQGYWARSEEGGVLRDLIHEVDYGLWLFGRPRGVFGTLRSGLRLGIESDEAAQALWTFSDGNTLSIGLDYLTRKPQRRVYAWGEFGEMEYDFIARRLQTRPLSGELQEKIFPVIPNDHYIEQMKAFLLVVRGQIPDCMSTVEDGLSALAVCDSWRKSAKSLRWEEMTG